MLGSIINAGASLFGSSKDDLIARALKPAIVHYLDGAGSASEVQVDTSSKTARITLDMNGEDRPVIIEVDRYSIEPSGSNALLVVREFSSPSHAWLATVAKKFTPEIKLDLPVPYAVAASIL
jgi:hypothetical protein